MSGGITSVLAHVALASPPFLVGLGLTWRLVWPRWKLVGKAVFYFGGVALLSWWIGWWAVLVGWLHQGLGIGFHVAFCRRHGFTWYAVDDPARYVALSKASVGFPQDP